jgi:hypothetical protein
MAEKKTIIITYIKALSKVQHHITQAGRDSYGEAPRIVNNDSKC